MGVDKLPPISVLYHWLPVWTGSHCVTNSWFSQKDGATALSSFGRRHGVNLFLFPNPNWNTQCWVAKDMWNSRGSAFIQCSVATSAQTISLSAGTMPHSENKMVISWKSQTLSFYHPKVNTGSDNGSVGPVALISVVWFPHITGQLGKIGLNDKGVWNVWRGRVDTDIKIVISAFHH